MSQFRREHLGFVFQDFNPLLDTFSLVDNIHACGFPHKGHAEWPPVFAPIARQLGGTKPAGWVPTRFRRTETKVRCGPRAYHKAGDCAGGRAHGRVGFQGASHKLPRMFGEINRWRPDHIDGDDPRGRASHAGRVCSSRTAWCSISFGSR